MATATNKKSFRELSQEELSALYIAYVTYRDRECDGFAKMNVHEFYAKRGLPEQA